MSKVIGNTVCHLTRYIYEEANDVAIVGGGYLSFNINEASLFKFCFTESY